MKCEFKVEEEQILRGNPIDEVVAGVANQKAKIVKRYQAEGRRVAMGSDGINDDPAYL